MCFVFIWEQTATCATYSINWMVFIAEMKSVYCAVRTGSLNKAARASSLKGWPTRRLYFKLLRLTTDKLILSSQKENCKVNLIKARYRPLKSLLYIQNKFITSKLFIVHTHCTDTWYHSDPLVYSNSFSTQRKEGYFMTRVCTVRWTAVLVVMNSGLSADRGSQLRQNNLELHDSC